MSHHICSQCGLELEDDRPCPACLLEFAAETELFQSSSSQPEIDIELVRQAAFPQLEIVEMIGRGGMGTVFKARQPKLDRFVALKIMPENQARHPSFAERFAREGKLLARLSHPNIVAVYDFGQTEIPVPGKEEPLTFFYLTMEYVEGVDLRHAMREERFSPEQALAIVPKICDALQYAHEEGVLHRDIKPENILLDLKGRVKIADFGIASVRTSEHDHFPASRSEETDQQLTETGQIVGTPNYMAPEQFEGTDQVDARADIYSLGVVFYELLTGQLPKGQFSPPSQSAPVGVEVDQIVQKALEKNRDRRYQSAEEFKTEIYHTSYVLNHKEKSPEVAVEKTSLQDKRRRFGLFLIFLAVIALVIFFALNGPPPERMNPRENVAEGTVAASADSETTQDRFADPQFLEETRRRIAMAWFIVIVLVTIIIVQYTRRRRRQ